MGIEVVAGRNDAAEGFGEGARYLSLHTASPGSTGANEVSGGTPAYARKQAIWSGASNGEISCTVTFDVPAGTTVTHVGVWSAVSGGTFKNWALADAPESFVTQGQLQVPADYVQS